MDFRKCLVLSAILFLGAVAPLCAQTASVPTAATRTYAFPPVGLATTETASITVVNTAPPVPAATGVVPSCTGSISFSNANGAIGTATSFTVGYGQFKTVALPFSSAGLTGIRGEILGQVSVSVAIPSSAFTPCSLSLSMETYDSVTGVTHAVLSGAAATLAEPFPPILVPLGR